MASAVAPPWPSRPRWAATICRSRGFVPGSKMARNSSSRGISFIRSMSCRRPQYVSATEQGSGGSNLRPTTAPAIWAIVSESVSIARRRWPSRGSLKRIAAASGRSRSAFASAVIATSRPPRWTATVSMAVRRSTRQRMVKPLSDKSPAETHAGQSVEAAVQVVAHQALVGLLLDRQCVQADAARQLGHLPREDRPMAPHGRGTQEESGLPAGWRRQERCCQADSSRSHNLRPSRGVPCTRSFGILRRSTS